MTAAFTVINGGKRLRQRQPLARNQPAKSVLPESLLWRLQRLDREQLALVEIVATAIAGSAAGKTTKKQ